MTHSMTALHSASQNAHQVPHLSDRHGEANHYTSLLMFGGKHGEVVPADKTDDIVRDFDAHSGDIDAINQRGFAERRLFMSAHIKSLRCRNNSNIHSVSLLFVERYAADNSVRNPNSSRIKINSAGDIDCCRPASMPTTCAARLSTPTPKEAA